MDAQSPQSYLPGFSDLLLTLAALVLVVAIILFLGWLAKRFNVTAGRNGNIPLKYVGQISVGSKEKVSIVDVGNERLVLGVTASQITLLSKQPQLDFQPHPLQTYTTQENEPKVSENKDKGVKKERHTPVFSEILEETKDESDSARI